VANVVLKIRLGALHSLDIVRHGGAGAGERHYLLVFSEKGVVQKRTLINLQMEQAARAGRFLLGHNVMSTPLETVLDIEEITMPEAVPQVVSDTEFDESTTDPQTPKPK